MTNDKVLLFKIHPASHGLSEEVIKEVCDKAELVRFEPGEYLHRSNEPLTSIFLIIHGRIRLSIFDIRGNVVMERHQVAGGQFGSVAAALAEPTPVDCVAEDPTTVLRLDYNDSLLLTKTHDAFRQNMVRLIAESIKNTIFQDRRPVAPRLVAMFHQSDSTRIVSKKLLGRLVEMGEKIFMLSDQPVTEDVEGIHQLCVVKEDGVLDERLVRDEMNKWLDSRRVFADYSTSFSNAVRTLEVCEKMFWCVTVENWEDSIAPLKEFLKRAPSWRAKITIVWVLEGQPVAPLATELRALAADDLKLSFVEPVVNEGVALKLGLERLVHRMQGIKIGVALGGGAARGMAHLGVLRALEENGIVVDMIAGTSAGAMTGTVYSSGMSVDYSVNSFVNDLKPSWFFRMLPHGEQWYLLYKYRRGLFDPMLRKYLQDFHLEQLPISMQTITVDLISGNTVVREVGDAVHGIIESINLPVLSTPINREGQALVDGGLINNVPADVLVAQGCNFVIAVSVTAKMETVFARNNSETPTGSMRSASTLQTVLRSYLVQSASVNSYGVEPADVVIEPDVTAFDLTAFMRTDELAEVGESATLEVVPEIKRLLTQLDGKLFPAEKTE